MSTVPERRCKASNRFGRPCQRHATESGFCAVHDPDVGQDMRALGKLGGAKSPGRGKARERASAERQSLRAYLREQVDPADVWASLKAALESTSETAKVAAAKVLLTELYEPQEEGLRGFTAGEAKVASDKLSELLERQITAAVRDVDAGTPYDPGKLSEMGRIVRRAVARAREGQEAALTAAIEKLLERVTAGVVMRDDMTGEQAREILRGLFSSGLIQPGPKWQSAVPKASDNGSGVNAESSG